MDAIDSPRGSADAKRAMRRAALGLHPHPTVISHALLQEHAPLSNTRVASGDMEPHTAADCGMPPQQAPPRHSRRTASSTS